MVFFPWLGGVVALIAVGWGVHVKRQGGGHRSTDSAQPHRAPFATQLSSEIYVIGDLHGDAECGKYWVDKLGIVDRESQTWLKPKASLVFMGDYIDKGPYGYQTLQLVKSLTDAFPDRVTALMGNHELELLRDRDPSTEFKYLHMSYSAVHPLEYLNFLQRDATPQDHQVLDTIVKLCMEIYARRWHEKVSHSPDLKSSWKYGMRSIVEFLDEDMQRPVREKLFEYQNSYLNAFSSATELGQWVERLPVIHVANKVAFTHGGLSEAVVEQIEALGGVDRFVNHVRNNTNQQNFAAFMGKPAGQAVYTMLTYRGNHRPDACHELSSVLNRLGVEKLVVGHTPGKIVRSSCSGHFWAVDSLLGRWIRSSGNFYCTHERRSSVDGNFRCKGIGNSCEGQVIRIFDKGVDVIS